MAEYSQVNYKQWNDTTKSWDIIYFNTTAGSVKESTTRRFLVPATHTINGKSFFNESYVAQEITLTGEDLNVSPSENTTVSAFLNTLNTNISNTDQKIENLKNQVGDIEGGNVVLSITAPSSNDARKGNVDLTPDFALYLPVAGGSITGNLTVGGNAVISGNLTVSGTTTTVNSTTVEIEDTVVVLGKNNTASLTHPAGIAVPKYDGENSGALYFDSTGTAYVGDVTITDGNITSNGALPLVVRKNVEASSNGQLAMWKIENGITTAEPSGVILDNIAGSIEFDKGVLKLKSVNNKDIGSVTISLGSASTLSKAETIEYNSADNNSLPTSKAVSKFVMDYSNKITYSNTAPEHPRAGDIWIDTASAVTTTSA